MPAVEFTSIDAYTKEGVFNVHAYFKANKKAVRAIRDKLAEVVPIGHAMTPLQWRSAQLRLAQWFDSTAFDSYPAFPSHLRERLTSLLKCGYQPVPVYTGDKRPWGNDWQRSRGLPPFHENAQNTGILCDGLRAVDLDLDDPVEVTVARRLALELLGDRPLVRVRRNSSRCMLLYRAAEGAPAKRATLAGGGKVEVLGRGQQFVAYGKHPSGADLDWELRHPGQVPIEELQTITEEQVGEFFSRLSAELPTERAQQSERQQNSQSSGSFGFDFSNGERTDDKTRRLISEILLGASYHDALRDLAAQFASDGVPPVRIEGMLFALMDSAKQLPTPDEPNRWANRRAQIPDLVASAWRKYGPKAESAGEGAAQAAGLCILSYAEMLAMKPPDWLITGVLPDMSSTVLFGASNSFKSFLAIDMACCIATGIDWHGAAVRGPKPVLYIATEGAAGVGSKRVPAWMAHHKIPAERRNGIHLLPADVPLPQMSSVLREAIKAVFPDGVGLITIDVLAGTMPGPEKDDEVAKAWVGAVNELIRDLQLALLVVTHSPYGDEERMRGHSHLWGSFDTRLKAKGNAAQDTDGKGAKTTTLAVNRHKDHDSGTTWHFTLEEVPLDERPMESSLVPVMSGSPPKAKEAGLGKNQKTLINAFETYLDGNKHTTPDAPGYPQRPTPAVEVDSFYPFAAGQMTGKTTKERNKAVTDAITGLRERGLMAQNGGLLWRI